MKKLAFFEKDFYAYLQVNRLCFYHVCLHNVTVSENDLVAYLQVHRLCFYHVYLRNVVVLERDLHVVHYVLAICLVVAYILVNGLCLDHEHFSQFGVLGSAEAM